MFRRHLEKKTLQQITKNNHPFLTMTNFPEDDVSFQPTCKLQNFLQAFGR